MSLQKNKYDIPSIKDFNYRFIQLNNSLICFVVDDIIVSINDPSMVNYVSNITDYDIEKLTNYIDHLRTGRDTFDICRASASYVTRKTDFFRIIMNRDGLNIDNIEWLLNETPIPLQEEIEMTEEDIQRLLGKRIKIVKK